MTCISVLYLRLIQTVYKAHGISTTEFSEIANDQSATCIQNPVFSCSYISLPLH
ncbi:hypothetical protein Mapa_007386 [Marchantia paleacea]|nr:hypothetical protein Mapa_007386 [Marchantia paleacea]